MKFKLTIDEKRDLFIVSWNMHSPQVEKELHRLGGAFEDFNSYRFYIAYDNLKNIFSAIKPFGTVSMSKEDKSKVKEALHRIKTVSQLNHADSDAEVSELLREASPATAEALRHYQRAGVKFISLADSTLLADDPGSGKSLQAIGGLISAGVEGDILVLSPSIATQVTWPAEISRWAPDDEILRVVGTNKQRQAILTELRKKSKAKRRWVLCNIEMVRAKYHKAKVVDGKPIPSHYEYTYPELFFYDCYSSKKNPRLWPAIVCDESHKALVTDKAQSYKQTQTRCGIGKLSIAEGGRKIAISGTPFRGKVENLWGTLNWLFPNKFTSYWKWVDRWFETETEYFGANSAEKIVQISPSLKPQFYRSLEPFMLRRTKREIAPELPPKLYAGTLPFKAGESVDPSDNNDGMVGHWLEMTPKQKRAYKQMEDEAVANLDNGTIVANGVLAELIRLKQFSTCYGRVEMVEDIDGFKVPKFFPELPSNKLDWLMSFIQELGIEPGNNGDSPDNRKVVVASQFTSVINLFNDYLEEKGYWVAKITGEVSADDREIAVTEFQEDGGPQIFLLNTIAGGVALTIDRADDIVIMDETFIPDDQQQVEDRVHRVSRNHQVTIHYLRSLDSIEEKIARKTFNRDTMQKEILDGERGIDFARNILK